MKTRPTLSQVIGAAEYPISRGHATRERAESLIEAYIADGEVSECERPRAARYFNGNGAARWAVVLTDTALQPYT